MARGTTSTVYAAVLAPASVMPRTLAPRTPGGRRRTGGVTGTSRVLRASSRTLVLVAATLGAVALATVLALWWQRDSHPEVRPGALAAADVLEHPRPYVGRDVTVTGAVSVLTDRVMSIGDGDLVVVSRNALPSPYLYDGYGVGDVVVATGELAMLDAVGVVERLPHVSLLPSQFQEFERRPVLMATSVEPVASRPPEA